VRFYALEAWRIASDSDSDSDSDSEFVDSGGGPEDKQKWGRRGQHTRS